MTRKEAKWWVNHLFEIRKEGYFNKGMMEDAKEVEEAQHMAIEALDKMAELPSIDIVTCKDCEYSIEVKESDSIICRHPSQHSTYERTSDDYCSYGERAEDDEVREAR